MNVALALAGMGLQEMLVDDAFAPALAGMVLPEMPPELWALALGFLARRERPLRISMTRYWSWKMAQATLGEQIRARCLASNRVRRALGAVQSRSS